MKKVGFITNIDKDPTLKHTKELVNHVVNMGCDALVSKDVAAKIGYDNATIDHEEIYAKSDFIVVLGGDGTILRVARKACLYNTPILGVNFGNLGYLADVERTDGKVAIDKVIKEEYTIERRMMLDSWIERRGVSQDTSIALNEVCVNNSGFLKLIYFELSVNGQYIDTFRADGVIIATPTGSTAYSLSAGGPVLKPTTELIAITQICPHTLYSRPLVISGDDVVSVRVNSACNNVQITLDGQNSIQVAEGDIINIKSSKYHTDIIKTTDKCFYEILRKKMVK